MFKRRMDLSYVGQAPLLFSSCPKLTVIVDVDEMAVLPEYQGFGIGRKLLDYATKGAGVYNLPIVLVAALGELV